MSDVALIGAAATAVAALLLAAVRGVPVTDDEAWFLHVVDRCRMGDVLYRDVFYGATPLAVWVALLVVRVARPQLLVLRALSVGYFVAFLLAGVATLRSVGAPWWMTIGFGIGAVAFAGPTWGEDNQYGQLAFLASGVALACVAGWTAGGPAILVAVAGGSAAAALSAKQSVGAVTIVAITAAVASAGPSIGEVFAFAGGTVLVLVACLLAVAASDALPDLVRRTIGNKRTYLATGRLRPKEGMQEIRWRVPAGPVGALTRAVTTSVYVVLPLLVVAIGIDVAIMVRAMSASRSTPAVVGLAAGLIALAGAVPRADLPHVQGLVPLALLSLLCSAWAAADGVDVRMPVVIAAALAAWTALALVLSLLPVRRTGLGAAQVDRDLPHLRRLPVPRKAAGVSPADGEVLHRLTDGRVFLLRPDAAVWYLAADLRNPTAYDYPYASVFGADGQRETIEAIERGDVRWVCLPAPMEGRLAPRELQAFVASSMTPVADTPAGVLFALTAPPAGA